MNRCKTEITAHVAQVPEIKNGKKFHINIFWFSFLNMLHISDWSNYTPKMLRTTKHKALQMKRKASQESEDDKQHLKRKLMEEEA